MTRAPVRAPVRVRIFPAWWSPKVWPLLLFLAAAAGAAAWASQSDLARHHGPLWPWLLLMGACVAWRLRDPIAVLHPGGIEFASRSAEDESELGIAWRVRDAVPGEWMVVPTTSIADWRRESFGIRLTLRADRPGDSPRPVDFPLGGIREADRSRIVRWLTENVGT